MYVAEFANDRIEKFTADGKFITKWGSRGSADGQFNRPQYISLVILLQVMCMSQTFGK